MQLLKLTGFIAAVRKAKFNCLCEEHKRTNRCPSSLIGKEKRRTQRSRSSLRDRNSVIRTFVEEAIVLNEVNKVNLGVAR